MPKGIPLTQEEINRRRGEMLNAAMGVILHKGFLETSMREIAEAAGVGKSTLYDYFPSKDEIMIAYVVDEVERLTAQAQAIIAQDISVSEKFRRIWHNHLQSMLANKHMYIKISFESQRLSLESQQRIQVHRHAYQDMLCELVEEGIRQGEFRPVNPLLAIRGMFSLITPVAYTSRPTGSPEQMLEEALDIIFNGLAVKS
ncbi:MAG TPA: TetR/AcrR family transcriptional regulator [Anaerolineales bacterium]|nr:TetR/AcrR family transcriptional regulator [Anaerolineales bacterium]